MEHVAAALVASGEDGVGEAADGAVASANCADEAGAGVDEGGNFFGSVGGAGAEAGDLHGGEVVDVVAEVADRFEREVELRGEGAEGSGLVANALGDERDMHLFGVE